MWCRVTELEQDIRDKESKMAVLQAKLCAVGAVGEGNEAVAEITNLAQLLQTSTEENLMLCDEKEVSAALLIHVISMRTSLSLTYRPPLL